jgi:hypothetical protein
LPQLPSAFSTWITARPFFPDAWYCIFEAGTTVANRSSGPIPQGEGTMSDETHSGAAAWAIIAMMIVAILMAFTPARAGEAERKAYEAQKREYEQCLKTEGQNSPRCAELSDLDWDKSEVAPPKPPPFKPWQMAWQCNDIRVTVTGSQPAVTTFDLGGTIWGGSQFTVVMRMAGYAPVPELHMNGRPCVPLPPQVMRR